jgi:hypothetical protein
LTETISAANKGIRREVHSEECALKILYFDIDGTLFCNSEPKTALSNGIFEIAFRVAGFSKIVCVGNIVTAIHLFNSIKEPMDGLKLVFDICRGKFVDWDWFSEITELVQDPEHRAHCIDFASDWYYIDDLAEAFILKEGMSELFVSELGRRILVPDPYGDGKDILNWLSDK